MKTKTTIIEIEHDDLVDLLSTALYSSEIFIADYDREEYHKLSASSDGDCYEDRLAKMLLAGKTIVISDEFAEEADDYYGSLPHEWDEEYQTMDYRVSLEDFKRGLQNCLDGTFDANDEEEKPYIKKCMANLMAGDGDMDYPQAMSVLQVVVFGKMIYG